jgi:hypothetical protein
MSDNIAALAPDFSCSVAPAGKPLADIMPPTYDPVDSSLGQGKTVYFRRIVVRAT